MAKIKGQNFRIFWNDAVVPASTNCSITLTGNTEDITTKDIDDMFSRAAVLTKEWSAQVDTFQGDAAQLHDILSLFKAQFTTNVDNPPKVGWDQAGGVGNAMKGMAGFSRSGKAWMTDFNMVFNDRETVQVTLQFQGTGALS